MRYVISGIHSWWKKVSGEKHTLKLLKYNLKVARCWDHTQRTYVEIAKMAEI